MRLALLLLSIVALGAACRDPAASTPAPPAPEAERRDNAAAAEEVKLAHPEYRTRTTTLETTGRLVFNEERLVRITAPVTGRVVEVLVRPGDVVEPGHRLLVLDSPDAGLARADYAKAIADAERADHALRLARDLFEVRAVAQKEVRDAESEYRKATAERDRAAARLRTLGVDPERADGATTVAVTAPRSGVVVERNVTPGQVVAYGQSDLPSSLVVIADLSTMWVLADVYEPDVPRVRLGEAVSVTLPCCPGERYQGQVASHRGRHRQGVAHPQGARGGAQPRAGPQERDVRAGQHRYRDAPGPRGAPGGHPSRRQRDVRPGREGAGRVRAPASHRRGGGRGGGRDPRRADPGRHGGQRGRDPPEARGPMIERIVAFALQQRFVVLALALILTVGGIVSYGHLPIEAYPDVGDVKVEIITLWPGHAAEEVERLITIPLENELNGIASVTFLRSDTLFGLSNIRVLFADGTDDYWARQQVQERLAGAEIPSDAKPQLGALSGVIGEIFRYTLESKTLPLYELKAIQDWVLEREFKKVPGVADVVSWGGGTKQYQVVVDPGRLRAYNLTLKQVFDAVASNNSNAGSGYIAQGDYRIPVRGIGLLQSVADIESIVVAAQKGTPVRVRDIGEVAIGTAIRLGVLGRDHDDDLVQGIVLMRKGENPGQVIEGVKARAAEVSKLLPAGVELRPYYSRDRLVQTTVHTVLRNLIEGAVLVVILLTLFLYDIRAAFIVALTIPLSLLFAFIFMDLRGIPANLLSLGAIDFGIIVDGAVIMTESIVRRLAERRPHGARVAREVQHAAVEVARPLTFAVLIIMTVYVPILTFQRIEGKLFRPMAVTISLAVIGALVLTLTLIPVLASLLFRRPPAERESPLLRWLRRPYLPALRWCLRRPWRPVLGAAVGVVAALFVFSLLGKEFLPELDEGDLWVRTQFPVGISIEAVRPYVREIRERLLKFPEVRVVVSQLGAPDDGTDPEAPDNVEFYVGLRPREEWASPDKEKLVDAMTAALASIPGVTTNFSQPIKDNVDEALAGTKGELAIKLYGPDFFVMDAKAKEIAAVLREVRGVADLDYDHAPGQPQLQIVVDRRAAAR